MFEAAGERNPEEGRKITELTRRGVTVAINDLLCMKNSGAQIAMDFS